MFNLTLEERKVLLFLVAAVFIGFGISFALKRSARLEKILVADVDIGKLNLNEVKREDLERLHIFSVKLSEKIIAYRQERGSLNSLEELRSLKGMNDKRLKEMEKYFFLR